MNVSGCNLFFIDKSLKKSSKEEKVAQAKEGSSVAGGSPNRKEENVDFCQEGSWHFTLNFHFFFFFYITTDV